MRGVAILICMAAAGCVSANTPGSTSPPPETVRISTGSANMTLSTNPTLSANGGTVALPLDRAWLALRAAYDSLHIPVATYEPATHTIGNSGLRMRRQLGSVPLSKYLNCGSTQGTPSADTYEVQLSIITQARAETPGSTSIATTIDARARPITISGEFVQCTSTTMLEARILDFVKLQIRP